MIRPLHLHRYFPPSWSSLIPRAPLPIAGVTSYGVASSATSERVATPSSLIRAHAPDQNPPFDFTFRYFNRGVISRLQSFSNVQASMLARSPDCTYRCGSSHIVARAFTPRIARLVTCPEMWYHYMPESGNWHDGTFTRWIVALSAAPATFMPDAAQAVNRCPWTYPGVEIATSFDLVHTLSTPHRMVRLRSSL
jgi:hypothetical protein